MNFGPGSLLAQFNAEEARTAQKLSVRLSFWKDNVYGFPMPLLNSCNYNERNAYSCRCFPTNDLIPLAEATISPGIFLSLILSIRIKFYLICLLSYNLCDTITEFFLLIFTFKLNKRKRILKNIIIVVYFLCKIIIYWKNVNFLIKFWIYFSLHFLAYFNRFFYEKEKSMERKVFWSIFVIAFILIFQKFELITIQRWRDILPLL